MLRIRLSLSFQPVRIAGLGTFAVVRERVQNRKNDLVVVERPVFRLSRAVAKAYDLPYDNKDIPGKKKNPFAHSCSCVWSDPLLSKHPTFSLL